MKINIFQGKGRTAGLGRQKQNQNDYGDYGRDTFPGADECYRRCKRSLEVKRMLRQLQSWGILRLGKCKYIRYNRSVTPTGINETDTDRLSYIIEWKYKEFCLFLKTKDIKVICNTYFIYVQFSI